MFIPHTSKIEALSKAEPHRIEELEHIFLGLTSVYIDYANVRPWSNKLGWHIDLKRLKQFINCFSNVHDIAFYYGMIESSLDSRAIMHVANEAGYRVVTKPVKTLPMPIATKPNPYSVNNDVERFVHRGLHSTMSDNLVRELGSHLKSLMKKGVTHIHDYKCNFDVEMTWDIVKDLYLEQVSTFILWTGDADFEYPVKQLIQHGKNVIIFATSRRVSYELSNSGARIYDIQKIRNFICWNKEIEQKAKEAIQPPSSRVIDNLSLSS